MQAKHSQSRSRHTSAGRPRGSPGKRCYAIGDVHGRLDLLQGIVARIEQHNAERPLRDTAIVLLGDLIDRGPNSSGVIDFVRTFRPAYAHVYLIAGNHEELMLRSLDGETAALQLWMTNGGDATAQSYGVTLRSMEGIGLDGMIDRLRKAIPASHTAFLRSAVDSIRFGDYLLAHAGIRPGVALAEQKPTDLRWIRKPFLNSELDHGFVVIHGHSKQMEIAEKHNRVGIDTGAYRSGVLTTIWIEDDVRGFLQAVGSPDDPLGAELFD